MHEPASGARCFSSRFFYFLLVVSAAAWFMASQAQAQTCWVYTETQNAKTPIRCVQKSDLALVQLDRTDGAEHHFGCHC